MEFAPENRVGNIADFEVDAIVNSLGLGNGLKVYGGICKEIVKKANSKEYKNKIDNAKEVYVLGDIFVTSGYDLKCQHIINLVTPYYETDKKLDIYRDCIRRMLVEVDKRNIKSLAIPLIGCGANGYNEEVVYEQIFLICCQFLQFHPDVKIYIVKYNDGSRDDEEFEIASLERRKNILIKEITNESKKYTGKNNWNFKKEYKINDFRYLSDKNRESILLSSQNFKGVIDVKSYIEKYCSKRYGDISDYAIKLAFDKAKAYLKYGSDNPKTDGSKYLYDMSINSSIESFYKIIFALKMDYEEAQNFLNFFGKSFAHKGVDVNNDLVIKLLDEQVYDLYEINDRFAKESKNKRPLFEIKK